MIDEALAALRSSRDPMTKLRGTAEVIGALQQAVAEVTDIRRGAIDELRGQGWTLARIAKAAGVSVARLSQLGAAPRRPERALLSEDSHLVIALPAEAASYPDSGVTRQVIHRDDAEFTSMMERLAEQYGLTPHAEYLGRGDILDLNRSGLVVTCGPRQSPWLEQILASDSVYGFKQDEQSWYLLEHESRQRFYSPMRNGDNADYGYLGTLPRPDGKGSWLYIAGIHAPGSRAGAAYLSENIAAIYQQTRGHYWSCLVKCTYAPSTRKLKQVELLAPIKKRGRIK